MLQGTHASDFTTAGTVFKAAKYFSVNPKGGCSFHHYSFCETYFEILRPKHIRSAGPISKRNMKASKKLVTLMRYINHRAK